MTQHEAQAILDHAGREFARWVASNPQNPVARAVATRASAPIALPEVVKARSAGPGGAFWAGLAVSTAVVLILFLC
jgi:hypothetical protein